MPSVPAPQGPSLVDLAILRELEHQLNDRAAALGFVRTFMDLWETRYDRLATALEPFDRDAALDTLLSIKASAAMAGAVRLSRHAEEMEHAINCGDDTAATRLLSNMQICGQQTMRELREYYIKPLENW